MNEPKDTKEKHDLYKRIGIWIVLSALVIVAFAAVVGTVFEKYGGDRVEIEEVVFLPVSHDYSRGMSTMSYSMAAKYSDGNVGGLPETKGDLLIDGCPVKNARDNDESRGGTRKEEEVWTFTNSSTGRTGSVQKWTVPNNGMYTIEVWGAQGGVGNVGENSGGKGARMKGDIELTANDEINIVVGQKGCQGPSSSPGGGGGGTFVYKGSIGGDGLYIAAGGGGAGGEENTGNGAPGVKEKKGTNYNGTPSGQEGYAGASSGRGGGGAGWKSDASGSYGGHRWDGGSGSYWGGYGGAGAGDPSDGGGSGGGYSGGTHTGAGRNTWGEAAADRTISEIIKIMNPDVIPVTARSRSHISAVGVPLNTVINTRMGPVSISHSRTVEPPEDTVQAKIRSTRPIRAIILSAER